jgi:hypothetical protein
LHTTGHVNEWRSGDEPIVESLVVPFSMGVLDVLRHGAPEVPLPDRNQPVQTFFFDGPHDRSTYAFALGARAGVSTTRIPAILQLTPHVRAPLQAIGLESCVCAAARRF